MKHPSELLFFRYHAKDLSLFVWLSFRVHALRCEACGKRVAKEASERASVEALLDGARPSAKAPSRAWIGLSLATAAAVAIILFVVRPKPEIPIEDPGLRPKGGSSFVLNVAVDGGTDLLGDRCREGDALQAEYRSDKPFVLVIGVDPEKATRALVPLDGTQSTRLSGRSVETAPQSWVLDAVKGRERFVAFFSDVPLDAARAKEAAKLDRPELEGAITITRECVK